MTTVTELNPSAAAVAFGLARANNGSGFVAVAGGHGYLADANAATYIQLGWDTGGSSGAGVVDLDYASASIGSGEVVDGVASYHSLLFSGGVSGVFRVGSSETAIVLTSGAWQAYTAPPGQVAGTNWNSHFASLQTRWTIQLPPTDVGIIYEQKIRYIKYSRPTVTMVAPTASQVITTTTRPTITWNAAMDGGLQQYAYHIKIFTAAQVADGGFDPATTTPTWNSGVVISSSTSVQVSSHLTNGESYRVYVASAQRTPTSLYVHWSTYDTTWSVYRDFSISLAAPPVPTEITPVSGATVTTDVPTLGATLGASTVSGALVRAEWQLATDAGFTTAVRTITEASGDARASGLTTEVIPAGASELFQGTWFIRCREIDTTNGITGTWSASHSFTVAHAPSTGGHLPTGASSRDFGVGGDITFSWVFSDTSSTDTQTAYQVIVERVSDSLGIHDSGKQASTSPQATIAISSTYKNELLRWKVRVYDSDDVVGAYSDSHQFYARDAPVVAITSPVDPADTPTTPVTWTFTSADGYTQASWVVEIYLNSVAPANIVHVAGASNAEVTYDFTGSFAYVLGSTYVLVLTVTDSGGLATQETLEYEATWDPPAKPTETASTVSYESDGYVSISWTNAVEDGEWVSYGVYRREAGESAWTLIAEADEADTSYEVRDYLAGAGLDLEYVVVQRALRFGSELSSLYTPVEEVTPPESDYWLIHPTDTTLSVRLRSVRSDNFSEEYEQATHKIINRGRRVEYGTRFGYVGELEAQLYDVTGATAREQRLAIEAIKADKGYVYLRNPFGDVWKVAVSDIDVKRMAGVGQREFVTVSIPYQEVS
ncbi:MAG: hypothetical protein AB7O86_05750 [Porticoccaceae bacterium]